MERAMIVEQFKRLNAYTSEVRSTHTTPTSSSRDNLPVSSPSSRGGDEVIVSPEALLFQRAKEALKSVPEVRVGVIQRLQEQLQNGTYSVDGVLVAEKLIEAVARFARQ